jgi:hypothetical protein
MMTPEETKVLTYLRQHLLATGSEIAQACMPGGSFECAARILWHLEWLGYVVSYGQDAVQITERGLRHVKG